MTEKKPESEHKTIPYSRFKEITDKNKVLKTENERLRAQIEILEKVLKERLQNQ